MNTPVAGLKYNAGAVLTRQLQSVIALAGTETKGTILLQKTVNVDPNCPFFYLFSASPAGANGCAFLSKFEFSSGGSPLTSITVAWGDQGLLDGGPDTFVMLATTPNDGYVYMNDPVSSQCAYVMPGDLSNGFVIRWSALCDEVRITTSAYADVIYVAGLVSGIMQQPW